MENRSRTYIALFGEVDDQWERWYSFACDVAEGIGLPFRYYSSSRIDKVDVSPLRKYSPRGVQRVLKNNALASLGFYSIPEEFTQLVFDWELYLSRSVAKFDPGSVFFGCDSESTTLRHVFDRAPELMTHIKATYGFGGYRPYDRAAAMFAVGIGSGGDSKEESEEIARWGHDLLRFRRFERGYFRAAFPLNVLSPAHLGQRLGDGSVRSAIEAGRLPGSLTLLEDGMGLWMVDEPDLPEAQKILASNNLLV